MEADRAFVSRIHGVFHTPAEQARYIADGWERMQIVLSLLETLGDRGVTRVLELGANPYVMTTLIRRRFAFDLELANFFGDDAGASRATHTADVDGQPLSFAYAHFNVERDRFPYEDGSFDCVLFCEILEHLLIDPDHVLAEINRVVRPGGFVVVSTPNATRLTNLYFLALGRSIWEGYSANGPYGRHNREFTLAEVEELLGRHRFDVIHGEARNIQHLARRFTYLQWMRPNIWYEHVFVVGEKRPDRNVNGRRRPS